MKIIVNIAVLLSLTFITFVSAVSAKENNNNMVMVYFPLITHNAKIDKIQPIGDSITVGFDCEQGWRGMIRQSGFRFVGTVDGKHDGHGGWWTVGNPSGENIIDYIESWVDQSDPDYVLLMIGMNDYLNNVLDANKIILVLDKINVPVILMGIPNVGPIPDESITEYNQKLSKIASERNIQFVDIESVVGVDDMDSGGVHPNCNGYRKMADAISIAIANRK